MHACFVETDFTTTRRQSGFHITESDHDEVVDGVAATPSVVLSPTDWWQRCLFAAKEQPYHGGVCGPDHVFVIFASTDTTR